MFVMLTNYSCSLFYWSLIKNIKREKKRMPFVWGWQWQFRFIMCTFFFYWFSLWENETMRMTNLIFFQGLAVCDKLKQACFLSVATLNILNTLALECLRRNSMVLGGVKGKFDQLLDLIFDKLFDYISEWLLEQLLEQLFDYSTIYLTSC